MTYKEAYQILNLSENSSAFEIKEAYKTQAKKYHPDLYRGNKKFAEEKMKQINEAYDLLSKSGASKSNTSSSSKTSSNTSSQEESRRAKTQRKSEEEREYYSYIIQEEQEIFSKEEKKARSIVCILDMVDCILPLFCLFLLEYILNTLFKYVINTTVFFHAFQLFLLILLSFFNVACLVGFVYFVLKKLNSAFGRIGY